MDGKMSRLCLVGGFSMPMQQPTGMGGDVGGFFGYQGFEDDVNG